MINGEGGCFGAGCESSSGVDGCSGTCGGTCMSKPSARCEPKGPMTICGGTKRVSMSGDGDVEKRYVH